MEYYATVNGKPVKPCGKPLYFNEIEQRRKECLAEERKQRILKVREQSKEFARKVRNDVAAEKERRLCKLNEAKARELQIWNADTLARVQHNYTACFAPADYAPVGTAFYAAKVENEQRAALARMRAQQRYCPHVGKPHNNSNRWPLRSCLKKHTTCTQTSPIPATDNTERLSPKRCNKVFLNEIVCRCCPSDSDNDDLSDICKDISVSSLSDTELECETKQKSKANRSVKRSRQLCKTPAVVVALDIDANDVVTITSPAEIKDNFPQNNRQFTSIIRVSPRSRSCGKIDSCQCQPNCNCSEQGSSGTIGTTDTSGTKDDTTTTKNTPGSKDTRDSEDTATSKDNADSKDTTRAKDTTGSKSTINTTHSSGTIASKSSIQPKGSPKRSSNHQAYSALATKSTSTTGLECPKKESTEGGKRFSQVSDLLGKRSNKSTQIEENIRFSKDTQTDCRPPPSDKNKGPKFSLTASISKQISKTFSQDEQEQSTSQPGKKPTEAPLERNGIQEKLSPKNTTRSSLLKDAPRRSTDTVTFEQHSDNNDRQSSGKDCMSNYSIPVVDPVQYYDYNNKYTKAYGQPCDTVRFQPLNRTEPNAMQQARLEKQQRSTNIEKMAQMRKQCEERGQKALEREQVRRDCMELTEKLEALSKQHAPLLPTDANILGTHRFVDLATKKQVKMNARIEEMLMRPAIITCPEVACPEVKFKDPKSVTSKARQSQSVTCLNLGDTPPDNSDGSYPSSDSCRSILLGYVNDQSKQIKNDIDEYKSNPQRNEQKSKRLNNLLERIDQLRDALKNELESGASTADVQNVKEVIDSISNVRKERERILIDNITEEAIMPLQQREQKKARREQEKNKKVESKNDGPSTGGIKLKSKTESAPQLVSAKSGKPLEILIKVSGAHIKRSGVANAKKSSARSQGHKTKSPRKVSKLAASSSAKKSNKKAMVQKKPYISAVVKDATTQNAAAEANIHIELNSDDSNNSTNPISNVVAHSSYDSNSTAYRSLPPKVTNSVDKVVDKIPSKNRRVEADAELMQEPEGQLAPKQSRRHQSGQPPRLNPLIAHYVQRLLGMSRNSINTLGVSTSEIDTPSSSIVNTTANRPEMAEEEDILARERIERVQSFIDENHRLIHELEESLRTSNITDNALETSMKAFEIVWKQQLIESEKQKRLPAEQTQLQATNTQTILENNEKVLKLRMESQKSRDQIKKSTESEQDKQINFEVQRSRSKNKQHETPQTAIQGGDIQSTKVSSSLQKPKPVQQQTEGDVNVDAIQSQKIVSGKVTSTVPKTVQYQNLEKTKGKVAATTQKSIQSSENAVDADGTKRCPDFERYAELTTNCTQRIAELTQLINKVRKEKQKILESTLSSVSENERHSTEYMELPDTAQVGDGQRCNSDSSPQQFQDSISYLTHETSAELSRNEKAMSLEKHKATGRSRDSGISVSRPVTAQELHLDLESISLASNTQTTSHASMRKHKPPPSLTRFSPQLAEEELAHELSTILEVDTPVTSRLNATAIQTLPQGTSTTPPPTLHHAYLRSEFPTFEQYVRSLNLDLTQIDAEQSMRIQQEFDEIVAAFTEAKRNRDLQYQEFPSIGTYLQNLTSGYERSGDGNRTLSETLPENIEDLLVCLRKGSLSVKSFPTQKEYLQRMTTNTPEGDPLDTASLENFTLDSGRDPTTESETINIEDELKRRNVLQSSFRTLSRKGGKVDERLQSFPPMLIAESGIEKLSTSEAGTAELEKEFLGMGLRWHTTMLRKIKETQALSSSSTTTTSTTLVSASKHMPSARNTPTQAGTSDSSTSLAQKSDENITQEFRRPLNLRDFLTKELLKQNYTTSTSDSTDDSLRSSFIRSIIGTMTPSGKPAANSSTNNKVTASADRQKTSTPVASHGTQTGSAVNSSSMSISTQLFSGESRLSSVHY